jgi:hypothetical protein
MNNIWSISLEDYIEIMEEAIKLGREHGKKEGDNLEEEFFEIAKKKNKMPKHLGATNMDKDLLLGNLREETKLKILDLTQEKKNE